MRNVTEVHAILATVPDPEIPVLSILDLGILRDVVVSEEGEVEVIITPTYSGCPAMDMIAVNIKAALQEHGIDTVKITSVLTPAWTTAWMTESGRQKLRAYGIAPPESENLDIRAISGEKRIVACPNCGSKETTLVSQFGSTACKALFKCLDCLEPFDYFKCH